MIKKMLALISARNKEFYRDRTALVWSLLFPFIVLAGFTYGYSGRQDPVFRVTVFPAGAVSHATIQALNEAPGIELVSTDDESSAMKKLEHYQTDLVISVASTGSVVQSGAGGTTGAGLVGAGLRLTYSLNKDSDKGRLAERFLIAENKSQPSPQPVLESRTLSGQKLRYSDWLLPGLLAMNIMFGSMFGVGYVIVRYRKNGVLKRLRVTPLSAFQFLCSQVISRMLLMLLTSFVVLGGSMLLIGFRPNGSLIDFALFLCACSSAMISLGVVVAARISTEEVADGVLNLMTWPMIFLSGIWFSIDGASPWVKGAAKLMPLTHVVDGLRAILLEGAGLQQVMPQIVLLLCFSVVFLGIGSALFKWR